MDVTIAFPSELAPKLESAARRKGRDIVSFIQELVVKEVTTPTLDEILAPARAQFAASELTEEDFDQLFEEERQALWEEKHGK
jgi:hypothetical protein